MYKFLVKDDFKGVVEVFGKVVDFFVFIDMVNVLMGKCDLFMLEICLMLLLLIN